MHTPAPVRDTPRPGLVRAAWRSGAFAALGSTLAAAALSRHFTRHAASTTNATSHWLWDRAAFRVHRVTLRHTVAGYLIHHASSVFWALFFEAWRQRAPRRAATKAATVAVTAALVDYRVVPRRLTPGFEAHLPRGAVALVYAAFALGLLAGSRRRGTRTHRRAAAAPRAPQRRRAP
ncbi:hypothetical protein [Tahibacter harae]|uniref:Uncharacterized protein n=1 Tax=Tahibacter harae TaxID=2963937 RepID=A0ABT1QL74_9GAMM|nr:hypothetical protein [Tahibacter harae]MCQ4163266.1 hypothetical protein [Tahibacter harae]